jgi:hypothetical protein
MRSLLESLRIGCMQSSATPPGQSQQRLSVVGTFFNAPSA